MRIPRLGQAILVVAAVLPAFATAVGPLHVTPDRLLFDRHEFGRRAGG